MAGVTLPIVAVLLAALVIAAPLARWLGIGSVLGYLIAVVARLGVSGVQSARGARRVVTAGTVLAGTGLVARTHHGG